MRTCDRVTSVVAVDRWLSTSRSGRPKYRSQRSRCDWLRPFCDRVTAVSRFFRFFFLMIFSRIEKKQMGSHPVTRSQRRLRGVGAPPWHHRLVSTRAWARGPHRSWPRSAPGCRVVPCHGSSTIRRRASTRCGHNSCAMKGTHAWCSGAEFTGHPPSKGGRNGTLRGCAGGAAPELRIPTEKDMDIWQISIKTMTT